MLSTATDRRAFLRSAGAAGLVVLGGMRSRSFAAGGGPSYLSACRRPDGSFAVAVFGPESGILRTVPLPDRGHDVCASPDGRTGIAFARRPGTFAVAFDLTREREPTLFHAPEGRHFYGHGGFTPDGKLLFATENDYDNARGVVGLYHVTAEFERVGELDTYGVGPHEAMLMPDGRTLVVANGGIETHPAAGRLKLNLASMQASLAFVDLRSGDLLARHVLPHDVHQLSIRHVSFDAHGQVWFGCQYEGPTADRPPLVGHAALDREPVLLSAPEDVQFGLANYVGAMAASRDGEVIAASCPRGGRLVYWSADGGFLGTSAIRDTSGVTHGPGQGGFLATNGYGEVVAASPDAARRKFEADLAFDNHVAAIPGAEGA